MSSIHDRAAHAVHDIRSASVRRLPAAERLFYGGAAAFIGVSVFVGFWRSYLLRGLVAPPEFPISPLTPLVHLHGVVFLGWVLAFMLQVSLVSAGRRDLHRALGPAALVWAPLMMLLGTWTSLVSVVRNTAPGFMEPRAFLAFQILTVLVFGGLVAASFLARRDVQTHKRLMLIATIGLLPPAIARWPLPEAAYVLGMPVSFFAFADLALLPLVAWDLATRHRLHRATLWGGAVLVLSLPASMALASSSAWLAVADALVRLAQ